MFLGFIVIVTSTPLVPVINYKTLKHWLWGFANWWAKSQCLHLSFIPSVVCQGQTLILNQRHRCHKRRVQTMWSVKSQPWPDCMYCHHLGVFQTVCDKRGVDLTEKESTCQQVNHKMHFIFYSVWPDDQRLWQSHQGSVPKVTEQGSLSHRCICNQLPEGTA